MLDLISEEKVLSGDESRRQNIVMSRGTGEIAEFKEAVRAYKAVACGLLKRKEELNAQKKTTRDVDKIKELDLRISTLDAERYEVLADMRSMMEYIKEREKK